MDSLDGGVNERLQRVDVQGLLNMLKPIETQPRHDA